MSKEQIKIMNSTLDAVHSTLVGTRDGEGELAGLYEERRSKSDTFDQGYRYALQIIREGQIELANFMDKLKGEDDE